MKARFSNRMQLSFFRGRKINLMALALFTVLMSFIPVLTFGDVTEKIAVQDDLGVARFTVTSDGAVNATVFRGDGSGLTNIYLPVHRVL